MSAVASQIQWDPPAASSAPAQDATKSADIHWDQPAYDTTRTEDVKWEQDHPLNVEFNRALAAGNSHLATLTSLAKNDEDFAKIAGVMVDRNFSNMPYSGVLPSVDPETLQAEKIHGLDDPRYRHAPQWDTALELLGKNRTGDLATMTPSAFGENAYKALSPEDKRKFIENLMVGAGATPQAPTPAMVTPDMKLTAGQNALEKFVGGITGSARLAGIPTPAQAIGDPQLSQLQGQIQEQGAKENPVTSFTAGMAGAMLDPGMRAGGGAVGKAISPLVGESQGLIGAARAGLPAVAKELGRSSLENAAFGGGVEAASQLKSGQLDPQAIFAESLKQGVLGPVFHSTLGTVTDAIGRDAADHAAVNALVQNGMDRGMAAEAIRQWRWADDVIRGTRQTPEEQARQAFQERQAAAQANMPGQGAPSIRPQDIHWDQPEPLQETPNAVQKPSPEGILQRQPEQTGEAGGGRGRVEQGQQGQETPQAGQSQAPETPAGHAAVPVSDQGSQFGGYPVDVSPLAARRATDAIESGVTNAATREMRQTLAAQSDELGARADQARQQQSELEATKARVRQVGEDKEAFASLMQQQREQRIATYTPERLAQMDGGQLRAAADDLGVAFDAPSTTVPRILDAIQRRSLEAMSNKQLYDEAQKIVRENGIARVKPGTRETNIQLIQAWRNGRLQSNWTPDQPRTTVPEGATLPPQQSPPPPASATANEPASPTAQLEPNRDASAAPVAPQAIHTPERNASEPPVAAPAKPEAEHTAESLSAMTPREVAGIAKDMGLKVGTKAANIEAILAAQTPAPAQQPVERTAPGLASRGVKLAPFDIQQGPHGETGSLTVHDTSGKQLSTLDIDYNKETGVVRVKSLGAPGEKQNLGVSNIRGIGAALKSRYPDATSIEWNRMGTTGGVENRAVKADIQPGPAASEPPSRAVEPTPVAGASGASGGGGESTAKAAPRQPGPWTKARVEQEITSAASALRGDSHADFLDDLERRVDNQETGLHPDDLQGYSKADQNKLRPFVSKEGWSNHPIDHGTAQKILESSSANRIESDKELVRGSGETGRLLAWYHDTLTGSKKGILDISTPEKQDALMGKAWEINGRKFRLAHDDAGNLILRDDDIEFANPPAKIPYDRKAGIQEEGFAPPEPKSTTGQGSLLGPAFEGSNIGSKTASMFGDMRQGPANELEAQQQREAAEERAQVDKGQAKIFGFGGAAHAADPNASAPPEKPNVSPLLGRVPEGAILPKVADAARGFVQSARWLRDTFAPQTASDRARSVSEGLREAMATAARNEEQVKAALAKAHWFFDGRTQKQNRDFIDRFQAGEQQPTPQLQAIADAWKSINRDQTDRMDQLDPEMKRQWEENHIKQVWKESAGDPGKVGSVVAQLLSKRPLEGSKGFLKQKSYLTYKEGREAGLTPLYENPVDAMMHGFSEAEKFIQMRKFANQLIHSGVAKFVRAGDQVPDGMKLIDDPAFTVYLPPTMAVNEYVNRSVHDALQSAADKLGVRIKTVPSGQGLIRGSLGTANSGTGEAIRRFGTDIGVLAHEVGHQLDFKYGLSKEFLQPKYAEEMRALADLYEPDTPSQQRYVRRGEEKIAAMLDAYMTAPEAFRHAAPTVYERFQDFLASHDETAGLADFERTLAMKKLTTELPRGGITKAGAYAVPEDMAGVIGNHLSRGLKSNPIFKGYMSLNNGMNQVQLAGAFHAGFTSADAIISRNALALEQLARGKPWESVKSLVTSPLTPFTNAFAGHQLISEYLRPGTHPELSNIVNALVEGGARIHQDSALQSRAMSKMVRAFRQGNLLEGVLRLPVGIMDAVNRPLMEHLVPMQKWGVMGDLMREELDKLGPDATHEQVRTAARKVVDTVDNRMGQIVYDNLFMNRKAKDLMMAGMRSVGWNLGTVKEVGGGFASLPKNAVNILRGRGFSSHSAAYVLSLLGTTAAAGALYNYLATGQYPQTLQDFYQPRTGRKDENGDDVRVQLPTYMRDVAAAGHGVDWDHPGKIIGNLADMAASKVAPLPAALMDLARNKDYFGVQIANPDESLGGKTIDRAKFLAKQAEPFSITGMQRMGENATPAEKAEALIGVTPVPKRFTQTQAEQVASDIMDAKYGGQTRTAEQASASQYRASLVKQLKADPENGKKAIAAGVAAGRLTDKQAGAIAKQAGQSALQWHMRQFSATEALKVLDAANPEEKNAIENIVRDKIVKADMSRGEQDALFAQHGIKPPADLAITREHEDLNKKEKADTDRTSQINALDRQIAQADQNKDWNKGAKLRQQQAALRDQPKMTAAEAARLKALREYVRQKNLYEQRVKEGTMTESEGAAATQKAMDRVVSPAP